MKKHSWDDKEFAQVSFPHIKERRDGVELQKNVHLDEIGNALLCTKQFVGQDGNLGSTSVYHGCSECGLCSDV